MNFIRVLALAALLQSGVMGASSDDYVSEFNSLITRRLYFSAYQLLENTDPSNQDPDVFLKKVEMAEHFYIKQINRQAISFVDLKEDETLETVRKEGRMAPTFPLKQDSVTRKMLELYPKRKELNLVRANYLMIAYLHYGGQWASYSDVLSHAVEDAKAAHEAGFTSGLSLLALGMDALRNHAMSDAKKWLQKAKEKESKNPYVLLYWAEYLYQDGKFNDAISVLKPIKDAFHGIPRQQAFALQLMGRLHEAKSHNAEALGSYEESASLDSAPLETQLGLLRGRLASKKMDMATLQTLKLLKRTPTDAEMHIGIQAAYTKFESGYALPPIYREAIISMGSIPKSSGFLKLALGQYLFKQTENREEALILLRQAKQSFLTVYPPEHPLIQTVDALILSN